MPSFAISGGRRVKAPRVVVYGVEGIGKSTFASQFPDPVFIDTEGSTTYLDVNRFDPAPASWQELLDMVAYAKGALAAGQTLVVDTLDWAERLCEDAVCAKNRWAHISTPDYGKGYKALRTEFARLLDALSDVADKGINVVCTAHAKISKFEQPDEAGAYDRWSLKLLDTPNTSIASLVKEWGDAVLFANYKTIVEHTSDGKAKARGNKRVMYTSHDATFDAKNRWGLQPEVPFEFASIAAHVPTRSSYAAPVGAQDRVSQPIAPTPATASTQPMSVAQTAIQPPSQAPASAEAAGAFQVEAGERAEKQVALSKLRSLMAAWGITDGEMQLAVSSQGYATVQMPLESYRKDLLEYLLSQFDAVRGYIEQSRQTPIA